MQSERGAEMLGFLPWYYQDSEIMKSILNAQGYEIDSIRSTLENILSQFYATISDWGVSYWEKELGITPAEGTTLELRKAIVKAKLMRPPTMTPAQIKAIADCFIIGDSCTVREKNDAYYFYLEVPLSSKVYISALKKEIAAARPAHLDFSVVAFPEKKMVLNCGPSKEVLVPETSWTEHQKHTVFSKGMNASGAVAISSRTGTKTDKHSAYLFTAGRLNGAMRLNYSGAYSKNTMDIGNDVTVQYSVFTGMCLNSRAAPFYTNNSPGEIISKTVYEANWQDVVSRHGWGTNGSAKLEKSWQHTTNTTIHERSFQNPISAMNMVGKTSITREDIGKDVEIVEHIFTGAKTNDAALTMEEEIVSKESLLKYYVYTAGRLNGKSSRLNLNAASKQQMEINHSSSVSVVRKTFHAQLLNGTASTNNAPSTAIKRTVHIPLWRDVSHRTGGYCTNYCKSSVKTVDIVHTTPAVSRRVFNPEAGTLLNNHAVMGYLKL